MRRLAAVAAALLVLGACAGGDEDAGPDTTVTTTTLPRSSTTTTQPPRTVTDVNVCRLLRRTDLDAVLDNAGRGEATPTALPAEVGEVPALITGTCSWPSVDEPILTLTYLAPTTAADGPTHLNDVLATGTGFAEGGQVITLASGQETVGLLVDGDQQLREAAIVKRSALLYLLIDDEVSGRDTDALQAYADLLVAALVRAPR